MAVMRVAKADAQDIEELKKYLLKNEERNGRSFPIGWRRVVWAADILIEDCCNPTENHLELSPYLERLHVAPEQ